MSNKENYSIKIYLHDLIKINSRSKSLIFISLSWLVICGSIGMIFDTHLLKVSNQLDILHYFNGLRIILSILIIIIFVICNIFLFYKKKNYKHIFKFNIINIYLLYFFSQLIGLIANFPENFNFNNLYLLFLALGTLNFIIFASKYKSGGSLKNLFYLFLFFLFLVNLYILSTRFNEILELVIKGKSLYGITDANELLFDQAIPRVTGLSRSLAILNLFLIIGWFHFRDLFNWVGKNIYILIILMIGLLIWSLNSRGTILCYFFGLSIYLFFILKDTFLSKIKYLILFTMVPILFFYSAVNFNIINEDKNFLEGSRDKDKIFLEDSGDKYKIFLEGSRFTGNTNVNYSSGRLELWNYSINNYDNSKIFGYGSQGDRYLLNEKFSHYGNNVSNGPIYALLSGGYFGLFFFILLYLRVIFNITITIFNPKLLRENYIITCSVIFVCFFLLRSTVENSFALFSVDFLIFIISNVLIEKFKKNKKLKINMFK